MERAVDAAQPRSVLHPPSGCVTVHLLSDEPATTDAFGSAHEKVASAIREMVESESQGGQAVALLGPWGSGKSSIVRMIEEGWRSSDRYRVFVYDAWAHSGDLLRRSFLEQVILWRRSLDGAWRPTNDGQLATALEQLATRRRVEESTTSPTVTGWGFVVALAVALVPCGAALVSRDDLIEAFWWVGGVLATLPVLLVALTAIWLACTRRLHSTGRQPLYALSLLTSPGSTGSRTTTHMEPEPSSVEFQKQFHEVLREAVASGRRVLIVIDNLDRVTEDEARAIWSTMQAFFEAPRGGAVDWRRRVWLLVPFEPKTAERLWRGTPGARDDDTQAALEIGDAFLEKTFQARFYVPPPLMSDWRKYFDACVLQAMPDLATRADERESAYQIYRMHLAARRQRPTPRGVKLLVNQMGCHRRMWQTAIPLQYIALYVLHERLIASPEYNFGSNHLIDARQRAEVSAAELGQYLAALHLNLEPAKAIEVLAGPVIKEALEQGEPDMMRDFATTSSFATLCNAVVADERTLWSAQRPECIALAAKALAETAVHPTDEIWERLRNAAQDVKSWPRWNTAVAIGCARLVTHVSGTHASELLPVILASLGSSLPEETAATKPVRPSGNPVLAPPSDALREWTAASLVLLREVQTARQALKPSCVIPVQAPYDTYLRLLWALADEEGDSVPWQAFVPAPPATADAQVAPGPFPEPAQAISALVNACQNGEFRIPHARVIAMVGDLAPDWPRHEVFEAIGDRLSGLPSDRAEAEGCLAAVILERGAASGHAPKVPEVGPAVAFHYLGNESDSLSALCLLALVEEDTRAFPFPGARELMLQGARRYQTLCEPCPTQAADLPLLRELITVLRAGRWPGWCHKIAHEEYGRLIGRTVGVVLEDANAGVLDSDEVVRLLPSSFVLESAVRLEGLVSENVLDGPTLARHCAGLAETDGLCLRCQEEVFDPGKAWLYRAVLASAISDLQRVALIDHLLEGLRALPQETWAVELVSPHHLMGLLEAASEACRASEMTHGLSDALKARAVEMIAEGAPLSAEQRAAITTGVTALGSSTLAALSDGLIRLLCDNTQHSIAAVVELYDIAVDDVSALARHWEGLPALFTEIVIRCDPAELRWEARALEQKPVVRALARHAAVGDLLHRIQDKAQDVGSGSEVGDLLGRMASALSSQKRLQR